MFKYKYTIRIEIHLIRKLFIFNYNDAGMKHLILLVIFFNVGFLQARQMGSKLNIQSGKLWKDPQGEPIDAVSFTLQLDATGDGVWYDYKTVSVPAKQSTEISFPAEIQSKWIRLVPNKNTVASAQFQYR